MTTRATILKRTASLWCFPNENENEKINVNEKIKFCRTKDFN